MRVRSATASGPRLARSSRTDRLEGLLPVQQPGGVAAHGATHPGAGPGVAPDQGVAHRPGSGRRAAAAAAVGAASRRDVRQRPGALAQGVVQGPQRVGGVVGEQLDGQLGGAVTDVDEVLEQLTGRRA